MQNFRFRFHLCTPTLTHTHKKHIHVLYTHTHIYFIACSYNSPIIKIIISVATVFFIVCNGLFFQHVCKNGKKAEIQQKNKTCTISNQLYM